MNYGQGCSQENQITGILKMNIAMIKLIFVAANDSRKINLLHSVVIDGTEEVATGLAESEPTAKADNSK